MHRFRDEVKLYKVIESCNTAEQLEAAANYISAYEAYYDMFELGGRMTLLTRANVLSETLKAPVCYDSVNYERAKYGLPELTNHAGGGGNET